MDMNVLLIEDDPVHVRLIRRAFGEDDHCRLQTVDSGDKALARLLDPDAANGDLPDLILLDLRLPTIDGFDVLDALRHDERTRRVPIVIISTSSRLEDIDRSYALGANAYVCKHSDFSELTRNIKMLRSFWLEAAELPSEQSTQTYSN